MLAARVEATTTVVSTSAKPSPGSAGPEEESILVHGPDRRASATVSMALVLRKGEAVAWADCEDPRSTPPETWRTWVESRWGGPVVEMVEPALLRPANLDRLLLRRLVASADGASETRLLNFLALPELFQRLAARALSTEGRGTVYLANADALAPPTLANTLGTLRLHQTLHEVGLSVVVSSGSPPPMALSGAFARVFHVEAPAGGAWREGWVTEESGDGQRRPLRSAWARLGLEPTLLDLR